MDRARRSSCWCVVAAAILALALSGCATHLVPAPGAQLVPGPGEGAAASAAGVTIIARVDTWTAFPPTLSLVVTPVLVTVENGGPVPIRVGRDLFALVTPEGVRHAAQAPEEIRGVVGTPSPAGLAYPRVGFGFGLSAGRFGRGIGGFGGGIGGGFGDPFYDDYYYPAMIDVRLPTPDMIQLALPEAVVDPGGRASGYLYFPRHWREAKRVDLVGRVVDARSVELGTTSIPFEVGKR
jgi:hypothetical protein